MRVSPKPSISSDASYWGGEFDGLARGQPGCAVCFEADVEVGCCEESSESVLRLTRGDESSLTITRRLVGVELDKEGSLSSLPAALAVGACVTNVGPVDALEAPVADMEE